MTVQTLNQLLAFIEEQQLDIDQLASVAQECQTCIPELLGVLDKKTQAKIYAECEEEVIESHFDYSPPLATQEIYLSWPEEEAMELSSND